MSDGAVFGGGGASNGGAWAAAAGARTATMKKKGASILRKVFIEPDKGNPPVGSIQEPKQRRTHKMEQIGI